MSCFPLTRILSIKISEMKSSELAIAAFCYIRGMNRDNKDAYMD